MHIRKILFRHVYPVTQADNIELPLQPDLKGQPVGRCGRSRGTRKKEARNASASALSPRDKASQVEFRLGGGPLLWIRSSDIGRHRFHMAEAVAEQDDFRRGWGPSLRPCPVYCLTWRHDEISVLGGMCHKPLNG